MNFARRLRELVIVLALLIVGAVVLRVSTRAPEQLNFIDRAILWFAVPVEYTVTSALRGASGAWRTYVALTDVKRENIRLTEENQRLQTELSRSRLAQDHVTRLERLLDMREEVPAETMAARVIGNSTSPHFRVVRLRLDRGGGEVKPNMVVLAPDGVVGRVLRVFDRYCDVMLVVDPDLSVDVKIPRSGARGVLKGMPGGEVTHIPQMPRGEDAVVGDEVVTSGIGGFPREIVLGKVVKVEKPDSGLWQEVIVQPSVDFARLGEVLIVLAAPPPPDPETGRKVPEPRRGLMAPR